MAKHEGPVSRTHAEKKGFWRCAVLGLAFLCIIGFYIVRLTALQHKSPNETRMIDGERVIVSKRKVSIRAARGEIRDRTGQTLVKNNTRYQLVLDAAVFPKDDEAANTLLATLLSILDEGNQTQSLRRSSCPIEEGFADGRYLYYPSEKAQTNAAQNKFQSYLETLGLPSDADTLTILSTMFLRYHLLTETDTGEAGTLLFDMHTAYRIACIRYDLEVLSFDTASPYVLCEDTDISIITPIKEQQLRGVGFIVKSERVYCYPGYASHILGRTGPIQVSKVDYYTAQGYPLDAIVGIDGIEYAFEEQLRGTDGEMLVEEDQYGNILSQKITKEAVAGKNVYLTIHMDLQKKAEDALADNITYIVENALSSGEALNGEDANAGALVVVDPYSGEILAAASYPTFDLTSYSAHFRELSQSENAPLLNRVLMGTYAPGSTFKVGVAAAALEHAIIAPDTCIDTKGIYDFYSDYQPRCWLYTKTGRSHGKIDVVEALCESCNWFFFDVGRQLGVTKMADYMRALGLGEPTGTELPEERGILSSPAYTDTQKIPWTGAATLQTAIGQGYNACTPIQLAMYLSTIVNGGTRYAAHFYLGAGDAQNDTVPTAAPPTVLGSVPLSESTWETLIRAMEEVAENGSATRIFRGYGIPVGAKTGTAEGDASASANGVFAAFAPLRNPELLCVSVIENGASGTSAGLCVRDVFDLWFNMHS